MSYVSVIEGVGKYLPEEVLTNHDLSKLMDTSDQWIQERTGIKERRRAKISQGTSDLAVEAAKQALDHAKCSVEEVDMILAATLSPDYFFPGIGVFIQQKLQAGCIPAIDIRGQCSGFAWSLANADAFIRMGTFKRILVVGAELHTKVIEYSNRGRDVSVLFGDGAGAVLLGGRESAQVATAQNQIRGLIDHDMGSDGSGIDKLCMRRPGFAAGFDQLLRPDEAVEKSYLPIMDGRHVFRHATTRLTESAAKLLERNKLKASDLDLVIPHQANLRINEMLRVKLKLPPEKVFNTIEKYGNTTAATIPIGMSDAVESGRLKKGDLVMTVAFGSGFTWGANLLRW